MTAPGYRVHRPGNFAAPVFVRLLSTDGPTRGFIATGMSLDLATDLALQLSLTSGQLSLTSGQLHLATQEPTT